MHRFRKAVLDRLDAGLSVAELARRADVSYDVIREIRRKPDGKTTIENAEKIAAAFGLTYDQFVGLKPSETVSEIDWIYVRLSPKFQAALMRKAKTYLEAQEDSAELETMGSGSQLRDN